MDYSFLIGIHNIDTEATAAVTHEDASAADGTADEPIDTEEEQRQLSARTEAWRAMQLDFNARQRPYE